MSEPRVAGDAARTLIKQQLTRHEQGIAERLAPFSAASALDTIHQVVRMVEEMINLPRFGSLSETEKAQLRAVPLAPIAAGELAPVLAARHLLIPRHGHAIAGRFGRMMIHLVDVMKNFRRNRIRLAAEDSLATIGDAMDFLQARRRHLVTLLYSCPDLCHGTRQLDLESAFPLLFVMIEHSCRTITNLRQQLALSHIYPEFELIIGPGGFVGSHHFETLESDFLEPERLSLIALQAERPEKISSFKREPIAPDKIFSAAELRNNVHALRAAYSVFGIDDSAFAAIAQLIIAFSRGCEDDYFIFIDRTRLDTMLAAQSAIARDVLERLLVNPSGAFADHANAHAPFVAVGDALITNVNLLGRFLYAFKNLHMASRKAFQIHAGFIFEDSVKRDLAALGFTITGIKRINRKEFDVVTILGDTIYNFQCKNSGIDLARLDHEPERFARANRKLVGYFRGALRKEVGREQLLQAKFERSAIEHFVISRFPVVTDDRRIINYNQLPDVIVRILTAAPAPHTPLR